jgi:hypothetical protein
MHSGSKFLYLKEVALCSSKEERFSIYILPGSWKQERLSSLNSAQVVKVTTLRNTRR